MKPSNLFSLKDKVILITGGYGHLGATISMALAEAGGNVVVLGRDEKKFNAAFKSFRDHTISFQKCDLEKSAQIKKAFSVVAKKHGKIDVLINNGFYCRGSKPEEISDKDWAYSMDGTLNSVYRSIREVIPYLKKNKSGGRIINVGSMYGVVSPQFAIYDRNPEFLNPPHYGAAKAGVIQLTRYFAAYLGKHGILVNSITPGAFPSEKVQQKKSFTDALKQRTMVGRVGKPEDLKGAFVFFSSDASQYITGQNLVVDGGFTAW